MKNSAYRNSKLKKQLARLKRNDCKEVIWSLGYDQKKFIERFYYVEEWLYKISTRSFNNVRDLPSILKILHYKNKTGKKYVVCRLKQNEVKLLNSYGIKHYPVKYKIHLIE